MKGLFLSLLLTGCTSLGNFTAADVLPSIKDCGDVSYIRHGGDANIDAHCEVQGAHPSMQKVQ